MLISCKTETKQNSINLDFINHVNKLQLLTVDEKCGEWGGDEKIITVYRDDFKGQLFADYDEKDKDCHSGKAPVTTKSRKRVSLDQSDKNLINDCINELCEIKLNKEDNISHSGLISRVMLSDSSIFIKDYPSEKWKKFDEFSKKLSQK